MQYQIPVGIYIQNANDSMETDEVLIESVFQQAQEKSPPDQMSNVLSMISKLSFQVEQLEKMTMRAH